MYFIYSYYNSISLISVQLLYLDSIRVILLILIYLIYYFIKFIIFKFISLFYLKISDIMVNLRLSAGNVKNPNVHKIGIIALGSHLENHGPALPIDTNTWESSIPLMR